MADISAQGVDREDWLAAHSQGPISHQFFLVQVDPDLHLTHLKKTRLRGLILKCRPEPIDSVESRKLGGDGRRYLILPSLYITCCRMTGSNFLISIFPG
jgi:hypothetical protein